MKVAIDTYGCTRNKADEEIIRSKIQKDPQMKETEIEESDIVVLNTCGVKNKTQSKMMNRLKRYREQGKKVLVAGCLPKINKKLLEERKAPMTGPNSIQKIPEAIKETMKGEKPVYLDNEKQPKLEMDTSPREGVTGIIPIAEGCLGNCTYCGVKNARGNLKSYPVQRIVNRTKQLLEQGKRQIYLTSQDTGCYGYNKDKKLPQLLKKLTNIRKKYKIRVGMMNPEHALKIRENLIKMVKNPKIYNFLHIPVQSGSNKVLEEMNRRYTSQEFKELVSKLKKHIPNFNLATDVIVGYPTETQQEFQETIQLIKETEPDIVNISRFLPRPNTEAEKLDPLPSEDLKKRSKKLTRITKKISKRRNQQYQGKKLDTLITQKKKKHHIGRTDSYKKVKVKGRTSPGNRVKVNVTETGPRGLKGQVINT